MGIREIGMQTIKIQIITLILSSALSQPEEITGNDTRIPVIAIISQPATTYDKMFPNGGENFSEVVGSYVDWIEQTGAEVALIPFDMPQTTLKQAQSLTQGMVQPGGAAELVHIEAKSKSITTAYQNRIHEIMQWVKERNDKGKYYPVWGTCLGMEELVVSFSGNKPRSLQDGFDDKNAVHTVKLNDAFWKSKFFGHLDIPKKTLKDTFDHPRSYYFHSEGITPEHFKSFKKLNESLRILGTSKNAQGKEFVAIVESPKYPIYMTQFHPEKTQFEKRIVYKNLDRSHGTISTMSSFAFRLVDSVRKNSKSITEIKDFIQSFFPYYHQAINSPVKSFERIYVFKNYFKLTPDAPPPKPKRARMMRMLTSYKDTLKQIKSANKKT